jgi:hypothetical protein
MVGYSVGNSVRIIVSSTLSTIVGGVCIYVGIWMLEVQDDKNSRFILTVLSDGVRLLTTVGISCRGRLVEE